MNPKDAVMQTPRPEELLRRAEAMIPTLRERAGRTQREGMVPRETVAEMNAAGFFRILQPRKWGGYEYDPIVFFDIVQRLARGCMSTAWIYGIQGAQPFLLAPFDDRALRDIYGEDSSVLMCSTFEPTPHVTLVEGGYRIRGRWGYLSGCDHCEWVGLGGIMPPDSPNPGERRIFLLPRRDWEIAQNWDVAGLQGTGSHDVTVADAFVPAYRTQPFADALNGRGPGLAVNTAPLYRIPFPQIFVHGATNSAIGALQGMFELFLEHGAKRVSVSGAKTAEDPVVQLLCAQTRVTLDEIDLVQRRNFNEMKTYAEAGQVPPTASRMQYKFQTAFAVERCSLLAARIFKASGTSAIFNRLPFARMLADINASRQHVMCQFEGSGRNWGAQMLGLPPRMDPML
jgi:3-hydroxy-9,10-secoandrosta-1,3,5(10)-triene-9,17-dione monooxygenase